MNQLARCHPSLGTWVSIDITAEVSDQRLISASHAGFDVVRDIHHRMSFHSETSELSQINTHAHKQWMPVSDSMHELLVQAKQLHVESDGLFDVSVAPLLMRAGLLPDRYHERNIGMSDVVIDNGSIHFNQPLALDLGGIAKGYAVDQALQVIVDELEGSLNQAVINAGGDMAVFDWQDFPIHIADGDKQLRPQVMLSQAVASSSAYYNGGAIYDKNTGHQALQKTVTVFADTCLVADALTKVAAIKPDHQVLSRYQAKVKLV